MKKIILCLCFIFLANCAGYEPLFSSKNLSFYIEAIENVNDSYITKKISNNLANNRLKTEGKKNYTLKITSNKKNEITSKDSTGVAATFEININVEIEVFYKNKKVPMNRFQINKSASYNNQTNKFDLAQYRKIIEENIIDKISQEITIKLQSL